MTRQRPGSARLILSMSEDTGQVAVTKGTIAPRFFGAGPNGLPAGRSKAAMFLFISITIRKVPRRSMPLNCGSFSRGDVGSKIAFEAKWRPFRFLSAPYIEPIPNL
jgi:hypothetical protein